MFVVFNGSSSGNGNLILISLTMKSEVSWLNFSAWRLLLSPNVTTLKYVEDARAVNGIF